MKIAIVHEWFTAVAGSEKVVEQILAIFPQADLWAVYADPETVASTEYLRSRNIRTSFINKLPFSKRLYRSFLPLMPLAVEQFDLSGYDVVISSAHAVSKGILTGPDQLHISYVHSPMRYAWDLQHQYLRESGFDQGASGLIVRWLLHKMRIWDYRTSHGVDYFLANSRFIGRRIRKVYGRTSDVIYPPVDTNRFELFQTKEDFFLTASRLVPYKRVDIVLDAFRQMPDKKLVVIGGGPDFDKLRKIASPNVELLGYQSFESLKRYMQRAKAFVFAAEEDFGITPVEAQACGTPVIAYGKGGSIETVVDDLDTSKSTGMLFPEQTAASLIDAVNRFEALVDPIKAVTCRANAELFSVERFRDEFSRYVHERWEEFQASVKSAR